MEKIYRMGLLKAVIDRCSKELEALKEEVRLEANGEPKGYHCNGVTVTVKRPGKPSVSLDTKLFQARSPKLYAEVFGKYSKVGNPRAPQVDIVTDGDVFTELLAELFGN